MPKSLIIAEKPSVGRDIAAALGCHEKKEGYIEGEKYIVTWAFGHLLSLKEPEDYNPSFKTWKYEDLPIIPERFETFVTSEGKKQFKIIKDLIWRPDVVEVINGGDAGREGELIQRYILAAAGCKKPVKRLWLSSLTKDEIIKGFQELKPASDYDRLYDAGKARAQIDWLIGMNYSRAYTLKNKTRSLVAVGRVQTAILKIICDRDRDILAFKPVPYKVVVADFSGIYKGRLVGPDGKTQIFDQDLALKAKNSCLGRKAKINKLDEKEKRESAPKLFNLTALQRAMSAKYKFPAQKTLDIAQKLYEKYKILSYPRTSSRYLTAGYASKLPGIIEKLKFGKFKDIINNLKITPYGALSDDTELPIKIVWPFVDDSKVTDHHALAPVDSNIIEGTYDLLDDDERSVFDEVVLRVLAQFAGEYVYKAIIAITNVLETDYNFKTTGRKVLVDGWTSVYKDQDESNSEMDEDSISKDMMVGMETIVKDIVVQDKQTEPAKRYTDGTLLAVLERYGIGTEATRAGIIETLINRKYIERMKQALVSTTQGRSVISVITTEGLTSVELTGQVEEKLEKILTGETTGAAIIALEAEKLWKEIGRLAAADISVSREVKSLGKCPICGQGEIVKKEGVGWGCTCYKDGCKMTIWQNVAGKTITEAIAKTLITKKRTGVLKGFKSKAGNPFEAALVVNELGQVQFEFKK